MKHQIDDVMINENFRDIYDNMQRIGRVYRTIPNVKEIREGEIFFFDDGTTRRLYVKINGVLRYVNLT